METRSPAAEQHPSGIIPARQSSQLPRRPDLERTRILTRLFDAGELELHEEGLSIIDAPMNVWLVWEADAVAALRGGTA